MASTVIQSITKTNTLNVAGLMYAKSDETTKFLDAIYARGKGTRKVNDIEFVLSAGYSLATPAQPAITEDASITGATPETTQRSNTTNCGQIYQRAVEVSYLKQATTGRMSGLNQEGSRNNVQDELDFQIAMRMKQMKMDFNYTCINGVYQQSTGTNVAWKSRGIIAGITTNVVDATDQTLGKDMITSAVTEAIKNGFVWEDGRMEMWVNPSMLEKINDAWAGLTGFSQPATRTEGGVAITSLYTYFGVINVYYDAAFPADTIAILNMGEIGTVETDVPGKGCWFYEDISKQGASEGGQVFGIAGLDYGAEQRHILIQNIGETSEGDLGG